MPKTSTNKAQEYAPALPTAAGPSSPEDSSKPPILDPRVAPVCQHVQRAVLSLMVVPQALPEEALAHSRADPIWSARLISDQDVDILLDLGFHPEHLLDPGTLQSADDMEGMPSQVSQLLLIRQQVLDAGVTPVPTPQSKRKAPPELSSDGEESDDSYPAPAYSPNPDDPPLQVQTRSSRQAAVAEKLAPSAAAAVRKHFRLDPKRPDEDFGSDMELDASLSSNDSYPPGQDDPRDRNIQLPKQLARMPTQDARNLVYDKTQYALEAAQASANVLSVPVEVKVRSRGASKTSFGDTDQDDDTLVMTALSILEAPFERWKRTLDDIEESIRIESECGSPSKKVFARVMDCLEDVEDELKKEREKCQWTMRTIVHDSRWPAVFRYSDGQRLPDLHLRQLDARSRGVTSRCKRIRQLVMFLQKSLSPHPYGPDLRGQDTDDDRDEADGGPSGGASRSSRPSGRPATSHLSSHVSSNVQTGANPTRVDSAAEGHKPSFTWDGTCLLQPDISLPVHLSRLVPVYGPDGSTTFRIEDLADQSRASHKVCNVFGTSSDTDSSHGTERPIARPKTTQPSLQRKTASLFQSQLRQLPVGNYSSKRVDFKEMNDYIRTQLRVLDCLTFADVVSFVKALTRFYALFPGQHLPWTRCISEGVMAILHPVLEKFHNDGKIANPPTRHLEDLPCQDLVLALVDIVAPISISDFRRQLSSLVTFNPPNGVPTLETWFDFLAALRKFQDGMFIATAKLGESKRFPAPSLLFRQRNGLAEILIELFSDQLMTPILEELYNPDATYDGLPTPENFKWIHVEAYLAAIHKLVQRNIVEAQRTAQYQAKFYPIPVKTVEPVKPRFSLLQAPTLRDSTDDDDEDIPMLIATDSDSDSPPRSPSMYATRGPFGAPGSGQAREGFRMDGTRVRPHPLSTQQFSTPSPSSTPPARVCFAFALGGVCSTPNCSYSHDVALAHSHLREKYERLLQHRERPPRLHLMDLDDEERLLIDSQKPKAD